MPELFIELLSEEMPSKLQIDARQVIEKKFKEELKLKEINFSLIKSFSTPKRLVFFIDGIPSVIKQKGKSLKGPKVGSPQLALEGFIKSNSIKKKDIYKKEVEKKEFYFADVKSKKINIIETLQKLIPELLNKYSWKKSMKWSTYDLNWGRPLRSIIALFDGKIVNFNIHHLKSSNTILFGDLNDEKQKKVNNFKYYLTLLKSQNIILSQAERKDFILKKFSKICILKKLKNQFNERLVEEVVNLVEKPSVITCKFNEIYLKIPKEILIVTMQKHQKYFPLFENNGDLSNLFLIVANLHDSKGYIKIGNERVIEARFSDAKFFWEKNKNQSLVKQVSKLKSLVFFNELGSFYDRTQRLKKLAGLISEQMNINKEKVEITASICKADLVSDLVGEFPELQGVLGMYFAREQGFEEDISLAISQHYLPIGINSEVPKKPISSAVAIIDKIDSLVGFFGINQKPSSSKDPFALRRAAIGLLRIIIENKLNIQINDLINCSISVYESQNVNLINNHVEKDVIFFLRERFKNLLKDKNIRHDIIEAIDFVHSNNNFLTLYNKCLIVNKYLKKNMYKNIIEAYKRASNIIDQEHKVEKNVITGKPESSLFSKDEEKNLFNKINEIRQYFLTNKRYENYDDTLKILAEAKPVTESFFDNVIVNDKNVDIKKNRLELLKMFCNTYDNFLDFSKMEGN